MTRVSGAALGLLLALVLSACGGNDTAAPPSVNTLPSASPSATEQPVVVTGVDDVEIGEGEAGNSPGGGLTFVTPVFDLGPDGDLGTTATVRMTLDYALPEGTRVLAGTRENDKAAWTWMPATLAADGKHAEFETDHFSQYGIASLDVAGALSTYKDAVQEGLVSAVDAKVKKPACVGEKEARKLGFKVTSTDQDTLAWCFGIEDNKPVLMIANRRLRPVVVAHGEQAATATAGKVKGVWTTWLGALNPGDESTFLAPGGTATYDADIESPGTFKVTAGSDAVAQSLRALYAGVNAIVAQATAYGLKPPTTVAMFQGLVARPTCSAALGKGSDALLSGCLSQERVQRLFGEDSELLDPLVTAPSLTRFWANRFAFLATQDTEVDTQEITIERAASDFGDLVGQFSGASRVVTVSKKGVVIESFNTPSGRVMQLTYQLSRPVVTGSGSGRTTSATALLKKVTVYDRKAINGDVPKAGSQGTMSITKGIVTPPFLQTTYCDKAALKKGSCD